MKWESATRLMRPRFRRYLEALKTELADIGATVKPDSPYEFSDDGFKMGIGFELAGRKVYADLDLNDAAEYGDCEEPDTLAAIQLTSVFEGGEIIISYAPHNYTPKCWVPLKRRELLERWEEFENGAPVDEVAGIIQGRVSETAPEPMEVMA